MKLLHTWWSRICSLFRRDTLEREMEEEFRTHLEMEAEHQQRHRALSPEQARRAARLEFGGVEQIKERERESRGIWWLETTLRDVRHGVRMLGKRPGFTAVAVLTLGLGLSANTTVFSIISYFFFRPIPVAQADQLVVLAKRSPKVDFATPLSWRDFEDYRAQVSEFSEMLALLFRPVHLGLPGRAPDRTYIEAVSGNYFRALGIQPLHGRLFLPGEGEKPASDPIVVLGHDYWVNQLGGDPGLVGETVMINGQPFRVVGIAPPTFTSVQWGLLPSAFIPATMATAIFPWDQGMMETREWPAFKVYALLAAGTSLAQAQAAVDVVQRRLTPEYRSPEEEAQSRIVVFSEPMARPDPSVAGVMPFAATVFMTLVVLVLLIACANVANLLFARAVARQREMGLRSALGASRGRLIRQLVAESVVLAVIAGAVALLLSTWTSMLLEHLPSGTGDAPVKRASTWEWSGVWFTAVASVAAGIIMSIIPALRATDVDVQAVVKGAPTSPRRLRHWFRNGLVISQVAFCAVVLISGGLFLRSLRQMGFIDLGFRPERLITASFDPALNGYTEERTRTLIDALIERLEGWPEVEAAAVATHLPLSISLDMRAALRSTDAGLSPAERANQEVQSGVNLVHHRYLDTMGVRLLSGRNFQPSDTADTTPVVIINQVLAEKLWPGQDAVGRHLQFPDGINREVVGVTPTGKYLMLGEQPRGYVFAPLTQLFGGPMVLQVRTRGDPALLAPQLRQIMKELDPHLPVFDVKTMDEHLRTSAFGYMPLRLAATMAGVQGALGLFLAVMGIYGVVAFSVVQRTREIGVRMALGATQRDILRLVMHSGVGLTVIGLGIGFVIALALSQVLAGLLYGLNPLDPAVFGGMLLLLLGVTAAACFLPARRALRVDPMIALRAE